MTLWPLRIAWFLALAIAPARAEPLRAIYPNIGGETSRSAYPLAVLHLALEASGQPYDLREDALPRTQSRVISDLEAGPDITVTWLGTSPEVETRLLPVRVPIWRGLLGYRLLLIERARQPEFSAVRSLADLARFSLGQGIGWSDIEILRRAGLRVTEAPYDALFRMLAAGRLDAFPRGAGEALAERDEFGKQDAQLAVERDLLLVYRFDMFFFTSRHDPALAAAIQHGLDTAYADGRFLALFHNHPAVTAMFELAQLDGRRRFDIANPLLTPETAALPPAYWYQPEK